MQEIIIGLSVLAFLIIIFIAPNIKIVRDDQALIIERLGSFLKIIDTKGVYILIPLIDRSIQSVDLKDIHRSCHFKVQHEAYTTSFHIKYVYQVTDVKLFVYAALDSIKAFESYVITYFEEHADAHDIDISILSEVCAHYGIRLKHMEVL